MQDFRQLMIWRRSHQLVLDVYGVTASFPATEQFGLTSQTRRAAASIPANIAEGVGRSGPAEFARFLNIASGSASELQYHLILAYDLNLIDESTFTHLDSELEQIRRMITTFTSRVNAGRKKPT